MAYEGWLEEQSGEATLSSASDDGSVTVRLAGVVDGASARTICDRLADIALRCHDRIVLDLSQVREISQFGALMTALAATIGTGNIVGVATAVAAGGPGAVL